MHVWGRSEIRKGFRWSNFKERDSLPELGLEERITLKWTLEKQDTIAWNGFIWLRIGTTGGLERQW